MGVDAAKGLSFFLSIQDLYQDICFKTSAKLPA